MDTMFMSSGNSEYLILIDHYSISKIKKTQKGVMNLLLYQMLVYIVRGKTQKTLTRTINLNDQLRQGAKNLNCLTNHIIYQTFKIASSIPLKI